MAVGALIFMGVTMAVGAVMQADAQRKQAHMQEDAAIQQAEQEKQHTEREEQIAKEKKAADITMALERKTFEEKTRGEKKDFVIGQLDKQEAELRASAIAGFAASGIDVEKSSSALAVFKKISAESNAQEGEVRKDYESFVAARDIEFEQLKTSEELSYDWFTSRLHQESQWTIENKYAEASAYRSKAKYATYGGYLGVAGAGAKAVGQAYDYGFIT